MSKLILFFLVLLMFCSCQKNQCACALKSQFEYQRFETNEYVIIINLIDNGAFGETADLLVCTKDKQLIEEIGIRYEDAKPKIEKVTNDRIYISYDYTFLGLKKENAILTFESIVLGDALINKENLKFKYVFYNKNGDD